MQRLVVEVARAERGSPARAGTGRPATVSRSAAARVELDAPRGEAAGGQHDGVGRQRPGARRLVHPHAAHPAVRALEAHGRRAQHEVARRPRAARRRARAAAACPAPTAGWSAPRRPARRAGPGGRSRPRPAAPARPSPGSSDESRRARSAAAARRPAGAARPGRRGRGRAPAPPRRPSPGRADQPTSTARALDRGALRQVGAALRLSARSAGIEVLERAQPDGHDAHRRRRGRPAAIAGGREGRRAGRRRPRVGSSMLRPGSPSWPRPRRPARGTRPAPRRGARGRGARRGGPGRSAARRARAGAGRRRPARARSPARRSCPATGAGPPRPWPPRSRRAPPCASRIAGDEPGQAGADDDDPRHTGRSGIAAGRCSTSSVPWKIQSSRHAWRIWSP